MYVYILKCKLNILKIVREKFDVRWCRLLVVNLYWCEAVVYDIYTLPIFSTRLINQGCASINLLNVNLLNVHKECANWAFELGLYSKI